MNLASLTTPEIKRLVSIFAVLSMVLAILIALTILTLRNETIKDHPLSTGLQAISGAVTLATIFFALLAKSPWRWDFPAWVMGRSVVHGVWHGNIWTNHGVAPGAPPRQIEIVLVIQQTYLALSISSFTATQEAESVIEAILRSAKTDASRLCYVYEMRRHYQGENKLTLGSGELKLLESGKRLKGHYFTNSPTEGEIDLQILTRDCTGIDCFDAATKLKRRLQPSSSLRESSQSIVTASRADE